MNTSTCDIADVRHGWLAPDGTFHEVDICGHYDFALSLRVSEEVLFYRGWIKLSDSQWSRLGYEPVTEVKQRQYDFIYEWFNARGQSVPESISC